MSRAYTENRAACNRRYDAKTYKRVQFALRIDDDAEILQDIANAQSDGLSLREWLNQLWEIKKQHA